MATMFAADEWRTIYVSAGLPQGACSVTLLWKKLVDLGFLSPNLSPAMSSDNFV